MVKTVRRRISDSRVILQLWEAITCIRQQRQVANLDRINKFMERTYKVTPKDALKQINCAVKDGLLVKELSQGRKGKSGETQDGYWCAEERVEESEEPHDWYCFTCHQGGEVLCCGTCYRVYHPACVQVEEPDRLLSMWICPICESCKKKSIQLSKWDLNKILLHVINRMKDKSRELTKKLNLNELPNYYNLVYQHMDLTIMMEKLNEKKYRSLEDFQGDAEAMIHVASIYHGVQSDRANLCKQTLEDCMHDISEIRLCKDCYIMSNDRTQKDWFCKPCNPPHELVWAQMMGFGSWPAKVLQKNKDKVDVRFFGSKHERAWIEEVHVKDADTDQKKLRIKPSQSWRSAVQEMHKYQANLDALNGKDDTMPTLLTPSPTVRARNTPHGRKRKRKRGGAGAAELNAEEKGAQAKKGDEKNETKKEDEEEAKGEAKHVVRSSSTTDAGQDHSVSTSQTSPEAADEPTVKKQKATEETPASVVQSKEETGPVTIEEEEEEMPKEEEEVEEERMEEDSQESEDTPPPPLEEEGGGGGGEGTSQEDETKEDDTKEPPKVTVSKVKESTAALRAKLEAEFKKKLEKAVKEAVEKAKKEWEAEKEKLLKEAKEKLASEIQKAKTETEQKCAKDHNQQVQKLSDEISQTKKKQWCINCEKEAMYHCCWNTSYCSISCQQVHWHQEHKRLCRRKR